MRALLLTCVLVLLAATPVAAQDLRGRVVDDNRRQGIENALVSLLDDEGGLRAEAVTDAGGFFRLRAPAPGTYTLVVMGAGYGEHRGTVTVTRGQTSMPAVVLRLDPMALDTLAVRARVQREGEPEPAGFQRGSHILAGDALARLERTGATLYTAVRELSTLRTREWVDGGGRTHRCVQSLRAPASGLQLGGGSGDGCAWVAIVVDGILMGGDPERSFREVQQLADYESVEYLPPAEAGRLYGMQASQSGALVLWSRGRGPHVSIRRNIRD